MSVENINLQVIFRKWLVLAKSETSPESNARICPKTCLQVRKTFLEKRIFIRGSFRITLFKIRKKIPIPSPGHSKVNQSPDGDQKILQDLGKALLKVVFARLFQRSRFRKSLSLREPGPLTKTSFDRFWSNNQKYFYNEEFYRIGAWPIDRKKNAESVGEYGRILFLLKIENLTRNSVSEDG